MAINQRKQEQLEAIVGTIVERNLSSMEGSPEAILQLTLQKLTAVINLSDSRFIEVREVQQLLQLFRESGGEKIQKLENVTEIAKRTAKEVVKVMAENNGRISSAEIPVIDASQISEDDTDALSNLQSETKPGYDIFDALEEEGILTKKKPTE